MEDHVLRQEKIDWKTLQWLQIRGKKGETTGLKELYKTEATKLVASLKKYGWVDPFKVWIDEEGTKWILDGHHREAILREMEIQGGDIPKLLAADIIDCKDKKEAAKFAILYTSRYAKPTGQGLYEHLEHFDIEFEDMSDAMNTVDIDMDAFRVEFYDPSYEPNYSPAETNKDITEMEIEKKARELAEKYISERGGIDAICPKCGHEFVFSDKRVG